MEAFQPDRDPEKGAAAVVEGHDVFFPDPIQTTVRREPQPSWSMEAYRATGHLSAEWFTHECEAIGENDSGDLLPASIGGL